MATSLQIPNTSSSLVLCARARARRHARKQASIHTHTHSRLPVTLHISLSKSSKDSAGEFAQLTHLQSPQAAEQFCPCFLHVHLLESQSVLQLQRMIYEVGSPEPAASWLAVAPDDPGGDAIPSRLDSDCSPSESTAALASTHACSSNSILTSTGFSAAQIWNSLSLSCFNHSPCLQISLYPPPPPTPHVRLSRVCV